MKKLGIFLLLTGFMIIVWNGYSLWQQTQAVTTNPVEIQERFENWDRTAYQQQLEIPIANKNVEEKPPSPAYSAGENVGTLNIPRIGTQYEVYWGTDEDTLTQGVGMYDSQWTVTPDNVGHVVLAGHRDTVFRQLGDLKEGDHLYVNYGEKTYDYQIRKIWITDAEDRTVIVSKSKPTLTLSTCYPFDFIGSAPDRYIVQAELVSVD
ncbi:class D sortase [Metaplanococcus flavidus]|uniref:Class D sortase n=1 Tax=Metaplanococcus flavidus TaxID=569883 RepID=A0ABW3LG28_9BACL